jgi:RNA polymerase sigma-70 factor (ECF subfamily)
MDSSDPAASPRAKSIEFESTAVLLSRARAGESQARERLFAQYLPLLERWASGRLPGHARGLVDTSDLVQATLIRSLDKVATFESQHEGAFLGYLRTTLLNQIRDEIRRTKRQPVREEIDEAIAASDPSPLEEAIGSDLLRRYEDALSRLSPAQQEALVMSIELGCTPEEIAQATGRPTAEAARVYVARAMVSLAKEMGRRGRETR